MPTVIDVPGISKLTDAELTAAMRAAERGLIPLDCLATIISRESGWDPSSTNDDSGATGLIQFIPSTAEALGTSTRALRRMSVVRQLDYVAKFYQRQAGLGTAGECADYAMRTFCPAAAGAPDDELLGVGPDAPLAFDRSAESPCGSSYGKVYDQNSGLAEGRPLLTVGDVRAGVRNTIALYSSRPRRSFELTEPSSSASGAVIVLALLLAAKRLAS